MGQLQVVPLNIRAEMSRRSVRQSALADRLGITQQAVSARLVGKVPFSVPQLEAVAELLEVEPGDLFRPIESGSHSKAGV